MNSRTILIATPLVACLLLGGCSTWSPRWDRDQWDMSRYRDPRAADIDRRLSERQPTPVRAPFSSADDPSE